MRNVDFVLIPEFVEKTLQRNSVSLATALDFHRLSKFLSINDIAQFLACQGYWSSVLNDPNFRYDCDLASIWKKTCGGDIDTNLLDQVCFINGAQGQTKDEALYRLIDKDPVGQSVPEQFRVVDLAPDMYGLVIRMGYDCTTETKKVVLRSMIKAINVYAPFNDVAKTEFFDLYLKTLTN